MNKLYVVVRYDYEGFDVFLVKSTTSQKAIVNALNYCRMMKIKDCCDRPIEARNLRATEVRMPNRESVLHVA